MLMTLLGITCLVLAVLSIIQQRKIRALRQGEEAFRTLAENNPDPIIRYDRQGRRLYINPAIVRIFGKPVEEQIGKSPADSALLDSGQNRKLVDGINSVFETGKTGVVEVVFENQEGQPRNHSMLLIPECDAEGQVNSVLGLSRDITAIRETERLVSNLVAQLPGFVFKLRMSADGHMSYPFASTRIEEFFGLRPEDVADDAAPLHAMTHPENAPQIITDIVESARTLSRFDQEYRLLRPGYPERWVQIIANPEPEAGGGVLWYGIFLDITERKRAEQDLKQALESIDGIINAIPDLLFEVDVNGTYLKVWTQDAALLAAQSESLLGKTIRDVLLPDDAETAMSAIDEAYRRGFSFGKVIRIELPQGERWFELSVSRKPGPSQADMHFIALSRDITERKRLEDELADSHNFLDRIIDAVADPIFVKDRKHRWVHLNEASCRLFGGTREELIGKSDFDFFPEHEARAFWEGDEVVFTGGRELATEDELTNKRGEKRYIFTRKTTFNDHHGSPILVGVISDITERKRMEGELADSRNLLDRIIDATPNPIFVKDRQHRWILANEAFCRLIGGTREEFIGKSDFDFFPEEEARFFWEGDELVFADGKKFSREEEITNSRGEKRYIFTRKTTFNDVHGNSLLVGAITDITERKRMELQLVAREHELRSLMEHLPANIARYTPDARSIYVNPSMESITEKPKEYFLGMTPMEIFPNGRYSEYERQILATAASGGRDEMEVVIPMADGEMGYHLIRFAAEHDEKGAVVSVLTIGTDITARKRAELALVARERELRTLMENIPDNIVRYTPDARHLYLNPVTERTTGKPSEYLEGKTVMECFPDGRYAEIERRVIATAASGDCDEIEMAVIVADGEVEYHFIRFVPERDEKGAVVSVLIIGTNITERKRAEEKLRLAASVFTNTNEGIVVTDADNRILDVNAAFTRVTGYTREEAIGKNPSLLKSQRHDPEFYAEMWRTLEQTGHWEGEIWNRRKNGEVYAEWLTISAVKDEQDKLISHYVAVFADISLIKEHEQQLERMAHHDALTGLPNRLLFIDRLKQAVALARRSGGLLAVCYGDLDGFKPVNDRYGHEAGDNVLVTIGGRMQECVRAVDTVGRMGGDEFVLLLLNLESVQECEMILTRILDAVAQPIHLNDHSVSVSASLGVALFPQDDVDPETLLRHSDQAMYLAKQAGKSLYRFFEPIRP